MIEFFSGIGGMRFAIHDAFACFALGSFGQKFSRCLVELAFAVVATKLDFLFRSLGSIDSFATEWAFVIENCRGFIFVCSLCKTNESGECEKTSDRDQLLHSKTPE